MKLPGEANHAATMYLASQVARRSLTLNFNCDVITSSQEVKTTSGLGIRKSDIETSVHQMSGGLDLTSKRGQASIRIQAVAKRSSEASLSRVVQLVVD
jgi:hypothetical protein